MARRRPAVALICVTAIGWRNDERSSACALLEDAPPAAAMTSPPGLAPRVSDTSGAGLLHVPGLSTQVVDSLPSLIQLSLSLRARPLAAQGSCDGDGLAPLPLPRPPLCDASPARPSGAWLIRRERCSCAAAMRWRWPGCWPAWPPLLLEYIHLRRCGDEKGGTASAACCLPDACSPARPLAAKPVVQLPAAGTASPPSPNEQPQEEASRAHEHGRCGNEHRVLAAHQQAKDAEVGQAGDAVGRRFRPAGIEEASREVGGAPLPSARRWCRAAMQGAGCGGTAVCTACCLVGSKRRPACRSAHRSAGWLKSKAPPRSGAAPPAAAAAGGGGAAAPARCWPAAAASRGSSSATGMEGGAGVGAGTWAGSTLQRERRCKHTHETWCGAPCDRPACSNRPAAHPARSRRR